LKNRRLAERRAGGNAVLRYEEADCATECGGGKRLLRSRPTVIFCQACLSFPSGHCCSDCKKPTVRATTHQPANGAQGDTCPANFLVGKNLAV